MVTKIHKGGRKIWHLAAWMKYKGIDDERLAGRVDRSRETVTRWRNQTREPKFADVAAIAAALDIEPYRLFMPPPQNERPSVDAILEDADAPAELARHLAELAAMWKTGT